MVGGETGGLAGEAIEIRSNGQTITVSAEDIASMVVGDQQEQVRFSVGHRLEMIVSEWERDGKGRF